MANEEIPLNLETVRRRLEQLDKESLELTDLIRKLKQIKGTLVSFQAETENSKKETEKWLREMESKCVDALKEMENTNLRFVASIKSFEEKADNLLAETAKRGDQILSQNKEILAGFSNRITAMIEKELKGKFDKNKKAFRPLWIGIVIALVLGVVSVGVQIWELLPKIDFQYF